MSCSPEFIKSGPLYIKSTASDNGNRELVPCNGYWLAPDIFFNNGVDDSTVLEGVGTSIMVRVNNKTANTIEDINVTAWVCDYTMGIGPNFARASAGGANGMTGFLASLAGNGSAVVQCNLSGLDWVPTDQDAHTNGGHLCIAANVTADTPAEGTPIPPNAFHFCCDSHHAQRNIHVVDVAFRERRFQIEMFTGNPFDRAIRVEAAVRPALRQADLGLAERRQLVQNGLVENADELPQIGGRDAKPGVVVPIDRIERATKAYMRAPLFLTRHGSWDKDIPLKVIGRGPKRANLQIEGFKGERKLTGELKPNEQRKTTLTVELDQSLPPGSIQILDTSMTDETGEVIGGCRIVAVISD